MSLIGVVMKAGGFRDVSCPARRCDAGRNLPGTGVGETVVRLHVEPMPEPKPAFKYHLLPEVRELIPGNAAQNYLKCFMEQRIFFFSERGIDERSPLI